MKKIIISAMLLLSVSLNAQNHLINSIDVFNLTNITQVIEINSNLYTIKKDRALNISCSEGEELEIHYSNSFEYISCGTTKELK